MKLTRIEKDLLQVSILQSIEGLDADPNRNKASLKETFDTAIIARQNLLKKMMDQVTVE